MVTVQLNVNEQENGNRRMQNQIARRRISPECWEQVKTAYASGIGLRDLARNTGIPAGTILSRAKRDGWTREIQSARVLVKRDDVLIASPVEAAAMTMRERAERHVERMVGISERGVDHIETMDGPGILRSIDEIEKLDKVARRTFRLDNVEPGQISLNVLNVAGDIVTG